MVDDFTRKCFGLRADTSLPGLRVGRELDGIIERRGYRPAENCARCGAGLTEIRRRVLALVLEARGYDDSH